MSPQYVTREYFIKRLSALCLRSGATDFPKDITDQHILLKSAVLTLGSGTAHAEKDINEKLEVWAREICSIKELDRVTMRRSLVDAGYLARSSDGASYQVAVPGPKADLFEPSIDELDIRQVIQEGREEIARRKREYQEKAKGT